MISYLYIDSTIHLNLAAGSPRSDFGMPSSHTAFVCCFFMYVVQRGGGLFSKVVTALLAGTVGVSRVHFLYHTPAQIACGAALGLAWGGWWYWVSYSAMTPIFVAWEDGTWLGHGLGFWSASKRSKIKSDSGEVATKAVKQD